jgi:hypothetical protein
MLSDAADDFIGLNHAAICVGWWKMCPYFRPIDALPPERVVWKLIKLVPANFLGEEMSDTEFVKDLREGC